MGRGTRTAGMAVVAMVTALALASPAQALTDGRGARPEARTAAVPIAIVVGSIGARIGVRYGPKLVKLIRGGSNAAKRGRSAARRVTRWGRHHAGRGRRAALAAYAAFTRLPHWVQGCGLGAVKARLHGANLVGMAIQCLRGILLVAGGKNPERDPGSFMSRAEPFPQTA